ncbi:MAG: hypothetical protein A2430_01925 [Candidatus Liptonbacteria bacterium RIFOXYC1_FULL_36_8]|uniref:Glycosyltransferase 2-like domain-containing protein n=3 Tax=Candidatus Liptoniibacteriota TaxID=1817909 RepID=A0A1G2CQS7_9BACT|nr:MAG: hypothetical protein A2390_02610 [Candidatus Liptonbacteria bacterium RIFOXYB1_FULL_36_10]OGZ03459.1 MAG: hypothetical protein A2604_00605 [Candidatus Liptonbacteria bacterium RIFOXYD1_FULL_36_11]OGZ03488.1 MAG: hypothetical protein A2430_01925 [Candidatus Liptonbacteria bacterium RIFOXYC1_FULL_36_8]
MNKTITIITPSYNQGLYIEETIQSVLSQVGNFYIDYIIADGGSTDQSVSIIKKYDQLIKNNSYPTKCLGIKYRWWSKKDRGQTDAINQGLKIATGNLISWLNSDDYLEPNALSKVFKEFINHPNYSLFYGDGYLLNQFNGNKKILKARPGNFQQFLKRGHDIFQPAAFFTKNIITKVGFLDQNMHYAFDYDFWLRILKVGHSYYFPETLATFRLWPNSKTSSKQNEFFKERKQIFKKYGGNIIDPKTIYQFRNMIPGTNLIYLRLPTIYNLIKKIFYSIIDHLHYRN